MVTEFRAPESERTPDTPDEILACTRAAVLAGEPWFAALLKAIARWRLPEETVGDRRYRYLIGGEAFDWLLLAERILDAIDDLIPAAEIDALLYHGRAPYEVSADEFRRAIGPAKYRAHLNYLYGVTVEEALQLAFEEEVEKERRAHVWPGNHSVEAVVFQRIYGSTREELLAAFRAERGLGSGDTISLDELKEFTYWLFKYRLRTCAPPRVASDTTRGLDRLARLEALRRPSASSFVCTQDVLDLRALPA
ncbi:MAG: hypothetical protein K6V36_10655 [Anaerolineae bacterium]|nr:hypothetical protein [Anaerolineae bacterium]